MSQVSSRPKGVQPQWDEGRVGQGESREEDEAQGAGDVGAAAQSAGKQGRHLGEAHRSDNEKQQTNYDNGWYDMTDNRGKNYETTFTNVS